MIYTKHYYYERFCFHVICCNEYRICSAKKRAIGIENINIRDLSLPRDGLFKLQAFFCFMDDVYFKMSFKIL